MRRYKGISTIVAPAALLAAALTMIGCESSNRVTDAIAASKQPMSDFDTAVDRPPTATTLFRMARLLTKQERMVEAEAVLLNTIQRYPDFKPSYIEIASLYVRQRQFDTAERALQRGLTMWPDDAVMHNDLGMCRMLRQDYEGAIGHFAAADEADPTNARYRANLALATGMTGRYDEAMTLYRDIIGEGQAHFNIAVICEAREDTVRAEEEFAAASLLGVKRRS